MPASLPAIFTGLRLGLGFAWVVIVVGEMTGVQTGLGAIIMEARQLSRTEIVICGMIVIGIAGFISDRLVDDARSTPPALESQLCLTRPIPSSRLRGVGKQFELQGERIEALRDAHLRVHKGEFVCLIGASGCGKSTLLRIVAGFETPTRGQALMWDKPIAGPGPERGMVFQDYGVVSVADSAQQHRFRPGLARTSRPKRSRKRPSILSRWSACSVSPTPIRTSCPAA